MILDNLNPIPIELFFSNIDGEGGGGVIPKFKSHNIIMSAGVYNMTTVMAVKMCLSCLRKMNREDRQV